MLRAVPGSRSLLRVARQVGLVVVLAYRAERALLAGKEDGAALSGMLPVQVALERARLDAGVRAVGALVGLGTRVAHLVAPQRIVVPCPVIAQVAGKWLLPGVLAQVHFERALVRRPVATVRAQEGPQLAVHRVPVQLEQAPLAEAPPALCTALSPHAAPRGTPLGLDVDRLVVS